MKNPEVRDQMKSRVQSPSPRGIRPSGGAVAVSGVIPRGKSRVIVPAGFSGWWCQHCENPAAIPDDLDATQARCPRCHKSTAVWVPPQAPEVQSPESLAPWDTAGGYPTGQVQSHRPRGEQARRLFEHMRACAENPDLNPDLAALEHAATIC